MEMTMKEKEPFTIRITWDYYDFALQALSRENGGAMIYDRSKIKEAMKGMFNAFALERGTEAISFETVDYWLDKVCKVPESTKTEYPDKISIVWTIEDFEGRAAEREEDEGQTIYDRSKFRKALTSMAFAHDATIGINWDTIEFWLDEECKLNPDAE